MTNLADRNIDTYIINMLHSFKNIERNLNRVKTHMEDIFLEDQIGTLAIKIVSELVLVDSLKTNPLSEERK